PDRSKEWISEDELRHPDTIRRGFLQRAPGAALDLDPRDARDPDRRTRIISTGTTLLAEARAEADRLCAAGLPARTNVPLDPQHPTIRRLTQQLHTLAGLMDGRQPIRVSFDQR